MRAPLMETPGVAVAAATQAREQIKQASIVGDATEKLKTMLIERAARAGVGVYETCSGGFVVGMWAGRREVPDLRALRRCLGEG